MIKAKEPAREAFEKVFEYSMAPLTGTQFCRDNYNFPPEANSEGGRMTPYIYQEGLMDVMCGENLGIRQITVMKSARIGYSAIAVNTLMYGLGKSRKNMAFYMSTDALAKKFTKDTIDPTFVLCPPVADALDDIKNRKKDDTATHKHPVSYTHLTLPTKRIV